MDEVWVWIIVFVVAIFVIVYIVLPIIGFILVVAVGIALLLAVAGSLSGVLIGIKNFIGTLQTAQKETQKNAEAETFPPPQTSFFSRFNKDPQPAFLIYFYDAAWGIINNLRTHVWVNTGRDAQTWFDWGSGFLVKASALNKGFDLAIIGALWWAAAALGAYVGGGFHYVAALFIVAIFILIQLVYIIIGVGFSSLIMLILSGINWLYAAYYRIYFRCPHPQCHSEMNIPIYICNQCGTQHTKLWPSIYGVFHHKCRGQMPDGSTCNNSLPTSDWWGRNTQLDRICPSCKRPLTKAIGSARNIHIPIVGGPSAGKSNYIVAATGQLIEKYAPENKLTIDIPDEKHKEDFERNIGLLKSGQKLLKTSDADENAMAYNLQIRRNHQRVPSLLYVYDASGEYFIEQTRAIQQVYFQYVHGVILIIDPFSIDLVKESYSDRLKKDGKILSPSEESAESVYERMLQIFETYFKLKNNKQFNHPIAIVLTKSDAFDLEDHIGSAAAHRLMKQNPDIHFEEDAIHFLVEDFITNHGGGNLIRNIKQQFSAVKFFSSSTVTANMDYHPLRVMSPLLWIMGQTNVLPVIKERTQQVDARDHVLIAKQSLGLIDTLRYYVWDSLKPIKPQIEISERE